jgi:hypothetical protein
VRLSAAWIRQAESDLQAGKKLDIPDRPSTFCQALSKYQQAVEKSVKGLASVLYDGGVLSAGLNRKHAVAPLFSAILKIPRSEDNRDYMEKLERVFAGFRQQYLKELDDLAPVYPAPGELHAKNHEYPFQDASGDWHPPCADTAFTSGEMKRFRVVANRVLSLGKIVKALELIYP